MVSHVRTHSNDLRSWSLRNPSGQTVLLLALTTETARYIGILLHFPGYSASSIEV